MRVAAFHNMPHLVGRHVFERLAGWTVESDLSQAIEMWRESSSLWMAVVRSYSEIGNAKRSKSWIVNASPFHVELRCGAMVASMNAYSLRREVLIPKQRIELTLGNDLADDPRLPSDLRLDVQNPDWSGEGYDNDVARLTLAS